MVKGTLGSDAAESGTWSGSTLFALNKVISLKYNNNTNNNNNNNNNKNNQKLLLLEMDWFKGYGRSVHLV